MLASLRSLRSPAKSEIMLLRLEPRQLQQAEHDNPEKDDQAHEIGGSVADLRPSCAAPDAHKQHKVPGDMCRKHQHRKPGRRAGGNEHQGEQRGRKAGNPIGNGPLEAIRMR